jgi:hypothetical protein
MGRTKTRTGPVKELRVVLSSEAYSRVVAQATQLDQTAASFARQVVMEKVVALEMAGSGTNMIKAMREFQDMAENMEEQRK